jgi:hypothetical protein
MDVTKNSEATHILGGDVDAFWLGKKMAERMARLREKHDWRRE